MQIAVNELRYGSIFSYNGNLFSAKYWYDSSEEGVIDVLVSLEDDKYPLAKVEAIPLTREWLIKFGFSYDKQRRKWVRGDLVRISISELKKGRFYCKNLRSYITSVHMFQLTFFVLERKELNFEL